MFEKRKDGDENQIETDRSTHYSPPPTPTNNASTVMGTRSAALIGATIRIKGDISGDENLIIEGKVEGSVQLKQNDVTVGSSGQVTANITASVVKIDGSVNGDISGVEKVIVSKSGKVEGNIIAPRVTLEDGAKFKGSIDMDPGVATSAKSPAPLKAAEKSRPGVEKSATDNSFVK